MRDVADRRDDEFGDEGAVRVGADDAFLHDLLGGDDHPLCSKGGFLLLADDAPDVGVPAARRSAARG